MTNKHSLEICQEEDTGTAETGLGGGGCFLYTPGTPETIDVATDWMLDAGGECEGGEYLITGGP